MSLVTALLVRNEADRYLSEVLARCATFSDSLLVLDDASTDASRDIAKKAGAWVRSRATDKRAWGNEAPARSQLWKWGTEAAKDGWLLICDADMLLEGDPKPYLTSTEVNTWSFVLYDLWNDRTTYRTDGFWQGHRFPRPWLFRPSQVPEGWEAIWPARGLHCGHAPANWPMLSGIAPDLAWLHLGWLTPEQRIEKVSRYLDQKDRLTPQEIAHAQSALE